MIDKDKNVRINVTIPKEMHEKLKKEAEYEGRSISNMAAAIIKLYYQPKRGKKKSIREIDD